MDLIVISQSMCNLWASYVISHLSSMSFLMRGEELLQVDNFHEFHKSLR